MPWTGLLIVAVVDVAVRGLLGFVGFKLLDMMSLFYADEAIASVVMVLVVRKVSINQRLSLAIEVVLTTKTFSIVVGSFLVTVLLRMIASERIPQHILMRNYFLQKLTDAPFRPDLQWLTWHWYRLGLEYFRCGLETDAV